MNSETLQSLLKAVAAGEIAPELALDRLKPLTFESIDDFAKIDRYRRDRTGFPEVIWGQDKTCEQIARIMDVMRQDDKVVMATRVSPPIYEQLQEKVPDVSYYPVARICAIVPERPMPTHPGRIVLLCAGTSDLPVAEEAAVTLELSGFQVKRITDVGVAGIHRLFAHQQEIAQADVAVVVAGMEGALPSVVAGLVACPTIAVPTSVGYGASFNGLAPLLTMLNTCAPGIGVVNIDNGFGAAVLAGQILRTGRRFQEDSTS
ncbi:MAG: nickel pincer cofactor biosynthesis protein LarB [Cyanobacteriota bacterium]|nr:nickel pincer cofactor biosynthesis protein LarB [Cyanobacteriota bacterium]